MIEKWQLIPWVKFKILLFKIYEHRIENSHEINGAANMNYCCLNEYIMIYFFDLLRDRNLAENQIDKNKPLKLGYDKWTNNNYSNKEFIINKVHELTNNKAFLNSRKKRINNLLVDKVKLEENLNFWKYSSILYPIILSLLIYSIMILYRKNF